jgi:monoamine oxidase
LRREIAIEIAGCEPIRLREVSVGEHLVSTQERAAHAERREQVLAHQVGPGARVELLGDEPGEREVGVGVVPERAGRAHEEHLVCERAVGEARELCVTLPAVPVGAVEDAALVADEVAHEQLVVPLGVVRELERGQQVFERVVEGEVARLDLAQERRGGQLLGGRADLHERLGLEGLEALPVLAPERPREGDLAALHDRDRHAQRGARLEVLEQRLHRRIEASVPATFVLASGSAGTARRGGASRGVAARPGPACAHFVVPTSEEREGQRDRRGEGGRLHRAMVPGRRLERLQSGSFATKRWFAARASFSLQLDGPWPRGRQSDTFVPLQELNMAKTPLFAALQRAFAKARGHATAPLSSDALTRRRAFLKAAASSMAAAAVPSLAGCGDDTVTPPDGEETVVIVGGGIAGLHCAYRLAEAGIKATIYEAQNRVGGRMFSAVGEFSEAPEQVCELGGELIDSGHSTLFALAEELGIVLDDRKAEPYGSLQQDTYYVNGALVTEETITAQFAAVAGQMAADFEAAETDDAAYATLDATSLDQYLQDVVPVAMYPELHAVLQAAYRGEYGLENAEQSCLNLVYLIGSDDPDPFRIFGVSDERYHTHTGNETFPRLIAEALEADQIKLGHALLAVRNVETGYELDFETDAGTVVVGATRVVFALPFTKLREADLSGLTLSEEKRDIIDNLGYGTNAKVMAGFSTRVWRETHGTNGGFTTDLDVQPPASSSSAAASSAAPSPTTSPTWAGKTSCCSSATAHLGHHLARRGPDGDVRLDLGDVHRDAQVHARPLRAARGETGPRDRLQAGRLHRGRGDADRLEEYRRVSAFNRHCGVDVHEISAARGEGAVPARAHRRHPRRLLREGGRPREPGRRHHGAGQGRAHAGRDDPRGRARHRRPHARGACHRRAHRPRRHRVRVRRQLRRHVGAPARRRPASTSRCRRPSTTTSSPSKIPGHRPVVAGARGPGRPTATSARRSAA